MANDDWALCRYYFKDDNSFNIFAYADKESKIKRCMECASADEKLTVARLERKMEKILPVQMFMRADASGIGFQVLKQSDFRHIINKSD